MNIERLESRIAPAVLVNPKTVTYFDSDGDAVTVKISKGAFEGVIGGAPGAGDFTFAASGPGEQLQLINLSNDAGEFAGATLMITATRGPAGGDGFANIGYINSTGFDLGAVTVDGDLGQIDAGDATTSTTGLAGLTVQSMGRFGLTTQGAIASLDSNITGKLATLRVRGDLMGTIAVTGGADGDLGSATIAGSLIGGFSAGKLAISGDIGKVTIGGDLIGGGHFDPPPAPGLPSTPVATGFISAGGRIASVSVTGSVIGGPVNFSGGITAGLAGIGSVTIGGNLVGGTASTTGVISASTLGAVKIGGDILGGSGFGTETISGVFSLSATGLISATISIASVTVGGSIVGGSPEGGADNFTSSGGIVCSGVIGTINLRGNLEGGDATGDQPLIGSGFIQAGRLRAVTIGGSVISGTDATTGSFDRSGSIGAGDDIGTLTVKGSLIGNSSHPVIITAEGAPAPTATMDVAMKTITIKGRVELAEILAGYNASRTAVNANAQIGSVTAGSWIASDLVAGCEDGGDGFGNFNDNQIGDATAGVDPIARIASITIKGQVIGTTAGPADSFGFVAEHIVSLRVGGTVIPLLPGPNSLGDFDLIGTTGDVRVVEVL